MFVKAKLINYTLPVNKLHLIALVTFLSLLVVFNQLYIYIYPKKNHSPTNTCISDNNMLPLHIKVTLKMRKKEQLNSIIEICPVRNVVARFGNKWALLVILVLGENGPIRYNELGRKIPDISSRVLSNTLRTLEADGLVLRTFYQEVPPRVEYSLTDTGRSLVPIIIKLTEWAQKNMKTIIEHRKKTQQAVQE